MWFLWSSWVRIRGRDALGCGCDIGGCWQQLGCVHLLWCGLSFLLFFWAAAVLDISYWWLGWGWCLWWLEWIWLVGYGFLGGCFCLPNLKFWVVGGGLRSCACICGFWELGNIFFLFYRETNTEKWFCLTVFSIT